MSTISAIVLPSLPKLTENIIIALYNAKTEADTGKVLDNFFSKYAAIRLNGKAVSRENLLRELQGEKLLEASASVTILGSVEGVNGTPANQASSLNVN